MRSRFLLALSLLAATPSFAGEKLPVPAKKIAAGAPVWVDSKPDDDLLNALVDIGQIKKVGDEYETTLNFPKSREMSIERVHCGQKDMYSFATKTWTEAPDGKKFDVKTYDADKERKETLASKYGTSSYGRDPRSLICWAMARKCAKEPFTWPPPPNKTPLEHSKKADDMRAAYAKKFYPACKA